MDNCSIDKGVINARFLLSYRASNGAPFLLDIDTRLPGRGITAIFGQSGSGKTTLLRCIAGLEKANEGHLCINGDTWQNERVFLPTHRRPLGYVFQESSLFPHLTAKGNLTYAIKRSGVASNSELYDQVMAIMGIEPVLQRYPAQLSGGERQRVAIARALLIQPRLLLMDEPLASLDVVRKQEILPYLERLRSTFDIPILYVSHSMDEVARLADHVVMLNQGKVIAQGGLADVFSRIDLPMRFQQDAGVILQCQVIEQDKHWHLIRVAYAGGELWVRDSGESVGQPVRIRVLAKDVSLALAAHDDTSILNRLRVEVREITTDHDEAMSLVRLKSGNEYLIARLTQRSVHQLKLEPGKQVWAQVKSVAILS